MWAFDHLKRTFDGVFEWFFGRELLPEDVEVEIFIYKFTCLSSLYVPAFNLRCA